MKLKLLLGVSTLFFTNFVNAQTCSPLTTFNEGFETTTTANFLPQCWLKIGTSTVNTVTTGVPNGSRHIYQYVAASGTPTIVILPELSNINAGTHWLKLKAKASGTGVAALNIGYVTNTSDAASFVLIKTLNIANNASVYTTSDNYSIEVPTSVPSNARLAVKNTADAKTYYWDDVVWEAKPSCITPTNLKVSNIGQNSAVFTWNASSSAPSNGYEYYYSTSNTPPSLAANASGSTGAGVTTATVPSGLTENTQYYVWVRSVCSGTDKSEWTFATAFKTLCTAITSLYENFDTYTGNIILECWDRILGDGTQTFATLYTPNGVAHVSQKAIAGQAPSIVILPPLANINAGTHRLRFKAKVTSASGSPALNVGYITNPSDASTFVNIQTLNVNQTAYNANAEYTINVPTTVPANARLAVRNTPDGKTYYWDDLYWEDKNALSTSEISGKSEISVYPNPVINTLSISDIENIKSIKITDFTGRTLKVIDSPSKDIDLSSLSSGSYLVTLYLKNGAQSSYKIVKK